jgi:hypothetical protein
VQANRHLLTLRNPSIYRALAGGPDRAAAQVLTGVDTFDATQTINGDGICPV